MPTTKTTTIANGISIHIYECRDQFAASGPEDFFVVSDAGTDFEDTLHATNAQAEGEVDRRREHYGR